MAKFWEWMQTMASSHCTSFHLEKKLSSSGSKRLRYVLLHVICKEANCNYDV
jgi:hypothetical protein